LVSPYKVVGKTEDYQPIKKDVCTEKDVKETFDIFEILDTDEVEYSEEN